MKGEVLFMKTFILRITVILLLTLPAANQCHAKLRQKTPRKETMKMSLLYEIYRPIRTNNGQNESSYIALRYPDKNDVPDLIKISYRFLDYEATIPAEFLGTESLHKFTAARDQRCDQSLGSIRNQLQKQVGETFRQFVDNSSSDSQMVQCFVITPDDYKSSKKTPGKGSVARVVVEASQQGN